MSLGVKLCDSCKTTSCSLFCGADSAYLCTDCDAEIHAANKLASRHARVWMCDVCEHAPATVTCKADAAALCAACDRDIHSANPLARRHQRFPVVPFYDPAAAANSAAEADGDDAAEAAEAASWLLLPNPNPKCADSDEDGKSAVDYLFSDANDDQYKFDFDFDRKVKRDEDQVYQQSGDGVVPQQARGTVPSDFAVVEGFPALAYGVDYCGGVSKAPFMYNFTSQSISPSLSSSSLEVGVVPDNNAMADVSNSLVTHGTEPVAVPLSSIEREARVLRYREKRKNRRFEKTIRYASRKAYAETRPRIKGRFAKRSEIGVEAFNPDSSYGVVPSY